MRMTVAGLGSPAGARLRILRLSRGRLWVHACATRRLDGSMSNTNEGTRGTIRALAGNTPRRLRPDSVFGLEFAPALGRPFAPDVGVVSVGLCHAFDQFERPPEGVSCERPGHQISRRGFGAPPVAAADGFGEDIDMDAEHVDARSCVACRPDWFGTPPLRVSCAMAAA